MSTGTAGPRRLRWLPVFVAITLLGGGLLIWALASQQGDPPSPAASDSSLLQPRDTTPTPAPTSTPDPIADDADDTGADPTQVAPTTTQPGNDPDSDGPDGEDVTQSPAEETADEPEIVALEASEPQHVRIPSIGVDSPMHALGLNPDGTLEVPSGDRFHEVAWYDGSPTPGEVGPAIIEGHVTGLDRGPSVFFDLGALTPGDLVEIDREDGTTATFEVYGLDSFPKDEFPRVQVYGNTSGAELRLITCGGEYDENVRHHVDNVVVFARLVTD